MSTAVAKNVQAELDAIRNGAAIFPLTDRAFLRISGPDAPRWLNGMVTNAVQKLAPGEGCYNFLLNAQGRIQGDCTIYREPENKEPVYVMETDSGQIEAIHSHLDKFIIMDDVVLQRMHWYDGGVLLIVGRDAAATLGAIDDPFLGDTLSGLEPLRIGYYRLTSEQVTTPAAGLVSRFEVTANSMLQILMNEANEAGATEVSAEAIEALRILEARPKFGVDIRDRDLPQETNQTHALSFNKGCYLGQEIVERIHARGQVHRLFTQFQLDGSMPALPCELTANDKPAGELTSAAEVDGRVLALGYARREALDLKQTLTYSGGTALPIQPTRSTL